ncbi:methionine--tRNA ligase [Mediterraneibacter sp.]|uniref:methionine--tRNA ligase n=1 Tax=Mediterraneibacter sp. TaxID=2316022 RepID=UPI0015ABC998|nr:methionine--tRNA ligase [Mediterraneibacter sp.]
MSEKQKYYITTAIAYTSGKPHIGNTYEIVLADAIARYKRSQGYDVFFQTGTDEHGQKIELKADEAGVTPKEFVDGVSSEIKRIWDLMDTSYDKFIRTTDEDHEKQVQKIFKKLYDQGDIYKGHYEGMYCTPCESFFTESQLVDGKCPDCGREVQPAKEEAYFFKMSKYADRLIEHINTHPEFIQPVSRKNEMMNNFLLPGLQDLCVSRTSFKWGIPVDFDDKHVVYVWLDALTNYITGIGYDADGNSTEQYAKLWPADLHLIGKDIIRFHTIYWPIFLMALGLPLPKQVFGHPWLLQGDGKMSKSKGNVLYADELVDFFGVDAVRYFVLHEMPFENDGVITWELMVERLNSDLANTLGNLVNRTVSMTNKYFGGVVSDKGVSEDVDADLKAVIDNTPKAVDAKMDGLRVADAITEIFNLFKRCNKYIDETMPWALAKEEEKKDRLETVLWNLIQGISAGARLLESFMPSTSKKILEQLGDGHVTEKPEILFQRLDLEEVMKKVEELHPHTEEAEETEDEDVIDIEAKPEITFEQFGAMQFQVGEIIACEAVKKSKKLLCSQVKIGSQVKQIVSGIKAHYTPEEMVGKKVMVLVNLKPAKLAGVLSEGMLLCAEDAEGNLALMTPEKKMPAGAEIC